MTQLPRSTPAEQGVDAAGIDAFVATLLAAPDVELHSFLVLRHGQVVAERWWHPYRPETPHLLYSLSKSFTSTALGLAVAEGLVDLDAPVLSYFPELDARVTDPRSRATLVRHVAAMASGHADDMFGPATAAGDGDMAPGLLLLPPDHDPGAFFAYNQPCTTTLSAIIARVSGGSLTEFLRPRLFEPLGIGTYGWWPDAVGRDQGFSGLHLTTESVAKLGQVYLDGGRWQGEQLLPPEWVAEATRLHVTTALENPDWAQGYGFQFWQSRHGYRGDGAYGQFLVVLPEADAVVAITSQSPDMQAVLDALWEHLRPALTAGTGPVGVWEPGPKYLATPVGDDSSATITEADHRPGADNQLSRLRAVRVGPGEITIDDGTAVTAALGEPGEWTVSGPLATAYAWAEGALLVDVIFVHSPHRLHLVLDPAAGTFAARWQTEPLGQVPPSDLRMPEPSRLSPADPAISARPS
ncbi:MAG: serine hydrolase domain-containing protein [Actinoplanes sp.]